MQAMWSAGKISFYSKNEKTIVSYQERRCQVALKRNISFSHFLPTYTQVFSVEIYLSDKNYSAKYRKKTFYLNYNLSHFRIM